MSTEIETETPWEEEFVRHIRQYIRRYREEHNYERPNSRQIIHEATSRLHSMGVAGTTRDNEEIWVYHSDTGLWKNDGEQYLRMLIDRGVEDLFTSSITREFAEKVRARTLMDRKSLGAPSGTVAVKNGLLQLDTHEMRRLAAEDKATWRLPVEYDPDADCLRFREFLDEIFSSPDIPMLQEYIGYALTGSTKQAKAFMLFGPTDSGKSVLYDTLHTFFGDASVASVAPQEYTNSRWGKAGLEGKQVNIRHDLDTERLEDIGILKEIISGNPIRAERKNQPLFEFQPQTKHFYAANRAPARSRDEKAFWNRWLTAVLPKSIPEKEQNKQLVEKLTTDDELSGILNWALDGYERLMSQGYFTNAPTVEENRRMWLRYGSSVDRFLWAHLRVTKRSKDFEYGDRLYDAYRRYTDEHDLEEVSRQKFTKELTRRDGIKKTKRARGDDRVRSYTGIVYEE